jgi:N-glycosidase YbiA
MAREADAAPRVIQFYSVSDEYGEFSNFARYPIQLKGKRWSTSEHYFQAQKFADVRDQEEIRRASTPMLAAQWGRDRKRKLRRDWESAKLGVMREAVEAKFRQHDDLRALLLATGDARLVEHTENDDFWGDGGDGSGRNELGRILMSVRDRLRGEVG